MTSENYEELVRNIIVNLQATQDEKIKRIADAMRYRIRRNYLSDKLLRGRIRELEAEIERIKHE